MSRSQASAAPGAGWMLGLTRAGLVAVGPGVDVHVEVAAAPSSLIDLVRALGRGACPAELALSVGASEAEASELRERLGLSGVPTVVPDAPEAPPAVPLAAVVSAAAQGHLPSEGIVVTADEALVLPAGIDGSVALDVLRRFVAGLEPDGRLEAYALLAQGQGCVVGDGCDPEVLRQRLRAAGVADGAVAVIELTDGGRTWMLPPDAVTGLGAAEAHRLGPVLRSWAAAPLDAEGEPLHRWLAEVAVADLTFPASVAERLVQGVGGREHARLVAHAEAAERFAASTHTGVELVLARRTELDDAIDPRTLVCGDARQERARGRAADDEPRPWCAAWTRGGQRRWVPAEAVFLSVLGPSAGSSSGVAAHLDLEDARQRAFCELIERDAFMWTWLQRLSRPRIAASTVPADVAGWVRTLARGGWEAIWVDLTLDTLPVVLCCAVSERDGLTLGAACHADPAQALRRATQEALVLALHQRADAERIAPEDVCGPADHGLLHHDPARRADHGFLYGSKATVELGDLGAAGAEHPETLLEGLGFEPLTVELTRTESAPYRVVRALAPGLVPISFGWDREPLGMQRIYRPLSTPHGMVGEVCNKDGKHVRMPHPFS